MEYRFFVNKKRREKMGFGEQLGMQAASGAVGGALGMMFGGLNDARQRRQQERLQEMQEQGNRRMMDYSYQKQMEMWNATNYEAQMEHMKKAGLNPALMYGMKGGGGVTAGSGGGPGVSGASAPVGGGEIGMAMQTGMQAQLLKAQKENIEADTANKQADAANKGADTELKGQQIETAFQGLQNLRQEYEVKKLDIAMKNIENFEKQASQNDRLSYIETQASIAKQQMIALGYDNKIARETVGANIQKIQAEAVGAVLQNLATQANIDLTREKRNEVTQNIMRDWDKMSLENRKIKVQELLQQWTTDPNREATRHAIDVIEDILRGAGKR